MVALAIGLAMSNGSWGEMQTIFTASTVPSSGLGSGTALSEQMSSSQDRLANQYASLSGPTLASEPPRSSRPAGGLVLIGPSCSVPERPADVLSQINAVRSSGGTCGRQSFGATAALNWNADLFSAAARHSADMAQRNYFDHVTPEGMDAPQRMEAAGYSWSAAGENIAAGQPSVQRVMADWLQSDGHCRNILNPSFTEVAVACVRATDSSYGQYWTMKLGRR